MGLETASYYIILQTTKYLTLRCLGRPILFRPPAPGAPKYRPAGVRNPEGQARLSGHLRAWRRERHHNGSCDHDRFCLGHESEHAVRRVAASPRHDDTDARFPTPVSGVRHPSAAPQLEHGFDNSLKSPYKGLIFFSFVRTNGRQLRRIGTSP